VQSRWDGSIFDFSANLEYLFHKDFGLGSGYLYFDAEEERNRTARIRNGIDLSSLSRVACSFRPGFRKFFTVKGLQVAVRAAQMQIKLRKCYDDTLFAEQAINDYRHLGTDP
jgi:hypothetical protein